jgi:hypothetical protein
MGREGREGIEHGERDVYGGDDRREIHYNAEGCFDSLNRKISNVRSICKERIYLILITKFDVLKNKMIFLETEIENK